MGTLCKGSPCLNPISRSGSVYFLIWLLFIFRPLTFVDWRVDEGLKLSGSLREEALDHQEHKAFDTFVQNVLIVLQSDFEFELLRILIVGEAISIFTC